MCAASVVLAADTSPASPDEPQLKNPLASKQQIVRDRMGQLEDRMFRLTEKLAKTDPDQAKRLQAALRQARELLVRRNMEETSALLESGKLTEAADRESAVSKDLEKVLQTLLEEGNGEARKAELDRLRAFERQVQQLLLEQQRLKDAKNRKLLELAKPQRELKDKTDALAQQMGKAAGADNAASSQPAGAQSQPADQQGQPSQGNNSEAQKGAESGEATPGQQNVQRAAQHMQDAAEKLQKSEDGSKDQQSALEQLEQARRELEQALDQLRREQQEEVLRGLEARFRGMLAQQLTINKSTDDLQARSAAWVHADELLLAGLGRDENKLADDAASASRILKEDGTSIMFPRIVDAMRGDMLDVAKRLATRQTAPPTQPTQAEIVRTLNELIEAIQQQRKELQASGPAQGGGGQGGNAALLPASAELKLLRSCQERINRDTARFPEPPPATDSEKLAEMKRIAERQRDLADMTRKINERVTGQ